MENFDTTGTQYTDAIIEYLDVNKDNQFALETTAIAASRVFSVPQNSDSLEMAKNNPAILKMWDISQKNNEIQKATIDQIIEVQQASHAFLQLINKREMLQAAAIITVKNQLNTLNIENQEIYNTIKRLAGNVLERFTQLEQKIEHVEAVASLTQWIQNLKWRNYKEDPQTKRFFRILEDFYFSSAKNFTLQNLESLKTALDQSDINPFDSISIKDFTAALVDELIAHDFHESMKHSPYNSKYSFEDVNNKITLPFLSSLYLISEEYNHLTKRRYPLDKIRDDVKQAALCYMKKDCGIDVTAKLEFYHLGIELLNGRRLIEFLDSPAVQISKTEKVTAGSPIEIDTSQERYQEYRDCFLSLLGDAESPGRIDDEEREILKLKQSLLKLSEEESAKIEESAIYNLQNKEEAEGKYKKEVRKVLDGNPEITVKKRLLLELSAQNLGIPSDTAQKCEEEIVEEIKKNVANKIEDYRKIIREKLNGTFSLNQKARIFLDLKIQELGLSKELADKCEKEEIDVVEFSADAESMYEMALKYFWGEGVSPDAAKAFNLCEQASQKGIVDASYFLSNFYSSGVVVERDYRKAEQLYKKARPNSSGYSLSDFLLDTGFVTKNRLQNASEGIVALQKEYEQGNMRAAHILGLAYSVGIGLSKDDATAVKFYSKAAEQGDAWAQANLGCCYYEGVGIEGNKAEGAKWLLKAADQGLQLPTRFLDDYFYNGVGFEENEAEAVKWYRKAAEQGDARAQNSLGDCYNLGFGVAENKTEAVKWYRKAAKQGDARAQGSLGDCYYSGFGVAENKTEAVKWYRKAADQGYPYAQFSLADCYFVGDGIGIARAEAAKWYNKFLENAEPANEDYEWRIEWGLLNDDIVIKNCSNEDWEQGNLFLEVTLKRKKDQFVEFYKVLPVPDLAPYDEHTFEDIMSISGGSNESINGVAVLHRLK